MFDVVSKHPPTDSVKLLDPNGGNLFTPSITAGPGYTAQPGRHN